MGGLSSFWRKVVIKMGAMSKIDEDAIHEIELRFNQAWGRHDAEGMVESLADDAQLLHRSTGNTTGTTYARASNRGSR
jgi:hypothetical protein